MLLAERGWVSLTSCKTEPDEDRLKRKGLGFRGLGV